MADLERRVRAHLAELAASGLQRALHPPDGVDLTSNDYLQLATHPVITARLSEAVLREGAGSTGSRLLRGQRDAFDDVERRFADFKRADRALYFSSGYLANLAVLTTLPEEGDLICSDLRNHASLIDGIRLSRARRTIVPHGDLDALATELRRARDTGHRFVVIESLYGMDGDMPPLADYAALCRQAGATLIVDEAHAVGVYGERGSGLIEAAGLDGEGLVSISTAGKALGVAGAFVAGPAWAIDYLMQRARTFVFSTAPPPALAAALDASLSIVADEPERRERVARLARHLRMRLAGAGIAVPPSGSHIVPVVIGPNERALAVADALRRRGFDVRAIRPPTVPSGTSRLRLSVNAGLSERVLDDLAGAMRAVLQGADSCSAVSS